MEIGIVGLPNVGKSALFKALTGMDVEVENYQFTTTKPARGTAAVPDSRLHLIGKYIETRKYVSATIDLVDLPAIVAGASSGEGLGNKFLEHLRQVDAIAHVVRCFDDDQVMHVNDNLDAVSDAEAVETELLLADLQVLESAKEKATRRACTGDTNAKHRVAVCEKGIATLEDEKPLRVVDWHEEETLEFRALGMITMRPVLYVANVSENDITGTSEQVEKLRAWVTKKEGADRGRVVSICAELEAEIAELDESERSEMLSGMGLEEPALAVLARALYQLLGLQSFYTAGLKETRAWTIHCGQTAPIAAGVIHSDIQRGFIRCETYSVDDLVEYESEKAIREAGKMRSEGKHYVMQDGDVCNFLFNA